MSDSDFKERADAIANALTEHADADGTPSLYMLICNGCGISVYTATFDALVEVTEGWRRGNELGDDDLCPRCASRLN